MMDLNHSGANVDLLLKLGLSGYYFAKLRNLMAYSISATPLYIALLFIQCTSFLVV